MSFVIIKNLVQREMLVVFKKNKKNKKTIFSGFFGMVFWVCFFGWIFFIELYLDVNFAFRLVSCFSFSAARVTLGLSKSVINQCCICKRIKNVLRYYSYNSLKRWSTFNLLEKVKCKMLCPSKCPPTLSLRQIYGSVSVCSHACGWYL
jgi:hypothetical protein